jgi:competence protein ComEC
MPTSRAPLFSVGMALALGCLVGLDGWISLRVALALLVPGALIWWALRRKEGASLAAFYLLVAVAGLAHTLLVASTIAPEDLRRLPDEKLFPTTQWHGFIVQEPVAQVSTSTVRYALDRTSFVLRATAWRPTGGRFFNAVNDAPWQPASGDIRCTLDGPAQDVRCGDRLETAMALVPVAPPLCPGELDYRAYEAEQGIYYHAGITALNWRRTETGGGDFWQNLSFRARDWAYARLQIGLEDDPRVADFLAGMLIGYRQQIPADIEQDFRRTGTLHVFAVSGQNIAELMVVVIVLLQLCGFVRWRWAWTLAPVVLLYCLVLAILLAWRLGRPLNALGCWSVALIAMLLWDPPILLDPGAQLSFAVVLGLILLGPPFMRLLYRPVAPDPFLPRKLLTVAQAREAAFWKYTCALLGATLAATVVSEPITMVDFHQVTPISVLANLIVVPAAGLITVVGTLGVTCSLFSTTWAMLLNNANWLFARLLIALVALLARQPGASLNVPDVRTFPTPLPSFVVAPVQDSACLLVRMPGRAWLFNAGREAPARNVTAHFLQFYGVNQLDGFVLAQMSIPDNGGAEVIVRGFHPRRLVVPVLRTKSPVEKIMPETIGLFGRPAESWQRGRCIDLAPDVRVEVLNPAPNEPQAHAEDRSLVLLFHVAGQTLLWAGKISPQLQQELLAAYPSLRADVLVLDPDSTPGAAWLRSLHVSQWLQIPRRDRQINSVGDNSAADSVGQVWPLDETGAVEIHFMAADGAKPSEMLLHPWAAWPRVR